MDRFIALVASGVAGGAIAALAAIGFLVIFKATGVVNFAQGDLITLAAYIAAWAGTEHGWAWYWTYPFVLVCMTVIGIVLERVAVAPLRRRPLFVVVIATLGAALVIRSLIAIWQGTDAKAVRSPLSGKVWRIAGANIAYQRVAIVIVAAVVIGLLLLMFARTAVGRDLRAVANDPETARLYGVRTNRLSTLAWGLSGLLAGIAAVLVGPLGAIDTSIGFNLMLTGFAASVLGGFGNLKGVAVAAILIGLVQQVLGGYVLSNYKETFPFILLIAVIAMRPQGLFNDDHGARV